MKNLIACDHPPRARGNAAAATAMALAAIASCLLPGPASAAPRNIVLRQLTNITTGMIESPKMQLQDGMDIAFVSTGDVLGPGTETTNRQIYLWHENPDGSGVLTQVTNSTGCESYDVARPTDTLATKRPMIIAFVSTCNLDPSVGNADGNPEIFFYEIGNGIFHQMTNTVPPVVNGDPFTAESGRCLVFRSNGNLDNNMPTNSHYSTNHVGPGFTNPDGSDEVFLYGTIESDEEYPYNGVFTQISQGPAGTVSAKPVIGGYVWARQCQTAAYQSNHDQMNLGLEGQQIYTYNMPASMLELMEAAEIPNGLPPGTSQNPTISQASPFARGPHIVFENDADLWNNGSVGSDLFDFRAFHPRMTQYTNVGSAVARMPQVSDGGGVITFDSNGELLTSKRAARDGSMPPFNADGNFEIFRLKGRRTVSQITRTEGCQNTSSTILDDGNRVGFLSTCDIVPGENPNARTQIFLYSLEHSDAPFFTSGNCTQELGCCMVTRNVQTCYSDLTGRKPDISRPNCLERDSCITE